MPPFAVTQEVMRERMGGQRAACACLCLSFSLPLSYFDRLTHACVDIQRCPLATPTRARYVNCQASKGSGAWGMGGVLWKESRRRAIAHKNQTNKWKTQKGMDSLFFCAGQGNCHLPSLHVLNLSFDLRPQLGRLLYRQYTHTLAHTCE